MVGCDNISALELALDVKSDPSTNMLDYNLLFAIHQEIKDSKIIWNTHHIRGHQDCSKMTQQLSRYERLNCKMDKLSKAVIKQDLPVPLNEVVGEPRSIYLTMRKL